MGRKKTIPTAAAVEKVLRDHDFGNFDLVYDDDVNRVLIYQIDWGDWKHAYAYFNYLISHNFRVEDIQEDITEEDGSDCYSATHAITY